MERFDAFVVGGGAAGSEVAFGLAARGGRRIGLAERSELGGLCTHNGCVPTKAMVRAAQIAHDARAAGRFGVRISDVTVDLAAVQARVRAVVTAQAGGEAPFKRAGIEVFPRSARVVGPHEVELDDATRVSADAIVLATGTEPEIPTVPGLPEGRPWTNREAIWSATDVPERLVVIGAGPIGLEFAQIYARFGSHVSVVEAGPQIVPHEDAEAAASLVDALRAERIELLTGVEVRSAERGPRGWTLTAADRELSADEVLVASGRRSVLDEHDLDAAGIRTDDGWVVLDAQLRTSAEDIWVVGDATGDLQFTHVANYEAGVVVDAVCGSPRRRDYRVVPRVTFTSPEVASVGLTEHEARQQHTNVRVGRLDLMHNERAAIDGRPAGLVKIVTDGSGQILGGHIVADRAGAMIHEVVALMAGRVPAGVASSAIHAYPTVSEAVQGALTAV